jgi:hypothetical protein
MAVGCYQGHRLGVGGGGSEWFVPPRAAESKGRGRIDILNENKVDILRSSHFRLLSQIKGYSVNKGDYFSDNFCCGRPSGLLTPGNKNRSYAIHRCS